MKIEELPHINIKREIIDKDNPVKSWYSQFRQKLGKEKGYIPQINIDSGGYNIISKLLDDDCVVAYFTDNSQTTFLVKTSRKYVEFVVLSEKLAKCLDDYSTRRITRITDWKYKGGFVSVSNGEDVIIADEDKWDNYLKTKLLEKLENG